MAMVPLEQANSQIEVQNVLSVPKDTTWMIPLSSRFCGDSLVICGWDAHLGLVSALHFAGISDDSKGVGMAFQPAKGYPKGHFLVYYHGFQLGECSGRCGMSDVQWLWCWLHLGDQPALPRGG